MDTIISLKTANEAENKRKKLIAARNKACALIEDAKARYVKEKTRARSKKAAEEKDALLSSPHFAKLADYDRREDIQDAYGVDAINESERDALEELWDEREEIKNKVVDGFYQDEVTKALFEAYVHIADLWEDQIEEADEVLKLFNKQREDAEHAADEALKAHAAAYSLAGI